MERSGLTLETIYTPIQRELAAVPAAILEILTTSNELASEVMRYFFSSQGKLLRPALTFLGASMKPREHGLDDRLLRIAASFEIFHAATLIHDDIIDSAYLRRGLPSVNVKWGPDTAVLVGDFMNHRAFGTLFENGNERITALLIQMAGTVCDGEIHELKEKNNFNLTEEEYFQIIEKKTAALLACCIESGGLLAGVTSEEAECLKRFGKFFGLAFQIIDDCLDFTACQNEFGKTLGADCSAGVLTLPLIRLLQLVDERTKSEVFKIFKSEIGTHKFQTLYTMVREYGAIDYALDKARWFADQARLELAVFHDSPAKRSLNTLVDYVIERNK